MTNIKGKESLQEREKKFAALKLEVNTNPAQTPRKTLAREKEVILKTHTNAEALAREKEVIDS